MTSKPCAMTEVAEPGNSAEVLTARRLSVMARSTSSATSSGRIILVWSIGWTFQSGADTAWVTDEIEDDPAPLIVRHAVWRSVGLLVGLPVAAVVGWWSLEGAMVVMGTAAVVVGLGLALVMPERGFTPAERSSDRRWSDAVRVWRAGAHVVLQSPMLRIVVGAMVLIGIADEAVDRLDVLRLVQLGLPQFADEQGVVFFGAIWWVMTLVNVPVMVWLAERGSSAGDRRAARLVQLLLVASAVGVTALALSPAISVAIAGWAVRDVGREVIDPVGVALANRHAVPESRATVISFRGQAEAMGEVIGGLTLGALARATSVPVALVCAAGVLVIAVLPFAATPPDGRGRRPTAPGGRRKSCLATHRGAGPPAWSWRRPCDTRVSIPTRNSSTSACCASQSPSTYARLT